jgi:hypothetical protein
MRPDDCLAGYQILMSKKRDGVENYHFNMGMGL